MKKVTAFLLAAVMLLGLAACGGGEDTKKVDLMALYDSCTANMTEMMPIEGDDRLGFMGIEEEDCLQVYTAFAADGLLTDEIWLIEAKDAEAMEKLSQLAQNRMKAKAEETVSYSPEQYAVVEKGVVLQEGLYLALLVSPNVDALKAEVEAAIR